MDRRVFLGSLAGFGMAGVLPAFAASWPVIGGSAFGSYWRVVPGGPVDTEAVQRAVTGVVEGIDGAMSPYLPGSELSLLNAGGGTDWRAIPAVLSSVLDSALSVGHASGGAFDPTVGGIVGRYGFGPIRGARVGDASDSTLRDGALRRAREGMTLDLCGIAKGRALDLIGAALRDLGIGHALVELGGEVLALGRHPDRRPWRVAVEAPGSGLAQAMELDGLAVATSGDLPQGYVVGGQRYGHIIDPKRGVPATGDLASVSVIAGTAMLADAWATALFALGVERAGDIAEARGLDTVLLVRDGAGLRTLTTGRAARWLI